MERGVRQHIKLATETEVLLVIWHKLEVVAQVALHIDGILDVEPVERHGILADRTGKGILQQAHLIVVYVDIGKDVLQGRVQDVARLDEVVDARGVLSFHYLFLAMGVLAIDMLGDGLVDTNGQDELIVEWAHLDLVEQPLALLELGVLKVDGLQVVHGQSNLLILGELIVRMVVEGGLLLGGNHSLHQLYGRIVLARVFALALRAHLHIP